MKFGHRWLVLTVVSAFVSASSATFSFPGDDLYARPGKRVDVGHRSLNLYCTGRGTPAVVLEAGLGGRASAWAQIQPALSRHARVCSYDRAGYAFSDPGPEPRIASAIADDLYAALHAAHERGPYILVGATFGTFDLRLFAARHEPEIAGMVFLNPSPEEEELEPASPTVARIDREGLNHAIACRNAALRGRLNRNGDDAHSCIPPASASLSVALNQSRAAMLRKPETWSALVSEWQHIRKSAAEVKAAHGHRFHVPLLIISAGREDPEESETDKSALHAAWVHWSRWQGDIAAISTNASLVRTQSSSRAIESTDPQLAIDGVNKLIGEVRSHSRSKL